MEYNLIDSVLTIVFFFVVIVGLFLFILFLMGAFEDGETIGGVIPQRDLRTEFLSEEVRASHSPWEVIREHKPEKRKQPMEIVWIDLKETKP